MFLFMNVSRDSEHCPKLTMIFTRVKPHSPLIYTDIPPCMPMGKHQDNCNKHLQIQLLWLKHKINFLIGFKKTSEQANKISLSLL